MEQELRFPLLMSNAKDEKSGVELQVFGTINEEDNAATNLSEEELETKPISRASGIIPQIFATCVLNLIMITYGMALAQVTIVIPALQSNSSDFQITNEQASWYASSSYMCVPFGCLLSGLLLDWIGKKTMMIFVCVPFAVAWILYYVATSVEMLYTCSILVGLSAGLMEAPTLTYVGEICVPSLRGPLSVLSSITVPVGVLMTFILSIYLEWRTIAISCMFVPIVTLVLLFLIPESPYWLLSKGRKVEAERALCWLRGWTDPSEIQLELSQMSSFVSVMQTNATFVDNVKMACQKDFIRPFTMVAFFFMVQNGSGIFAIRPYVIGILDKLGSPLDEFTSNMLFNLVYLGGGLLCVLLVKITGKRPLSIISCVAVTICTLALGMFSYFRLAMEVDVPLIPLVLFLGLYFFASLGIGSIPWSLLSEAFPMRLRGIGSGTSASLAYAGSFIMTKTFVNMQDSLNLHGTFLVYSGLSFLGIWYLYFFLVETEGHSLEEIELYFGSDCKDTPPISVLDEVVPYSSDEDISEK